MKYTIWHATQRSQRFLDVREPRSLYCYEIAGTVEADDHEGAFFRSQNGIPGYACTTVPNPTYLARHGGVRSLSVGDLLEDAQGNFVAVAGIGWTRLQYNPTTNIIQPEEQ